VSAQWSKAEDAILRKYAAKGPNLIIERGLLPGRKYAAICARRQKLGIQFSRGGMRSGQQKQPRKPARPAKPWTVEQRCAMLFHATAMAKDSGHTFAECITELARLQREHAKSA
jgi:hypothetical protein